jgi:hypothetical protein
MEVRQCVRTLLYRQGFVQNHSKVTSFPMKDEYTQYLSYNNPHSRAIKKAKYYKKHKVVVGSCWRWLFSCSKKGASLKLLSTALRYCKVRIQVGVYKRCRTGMEALKPRFYSSNQIWGYEQLCNFRI